MDQEFVAHYRITSKLGEGGMGEVYLAEDTKLRRSVALKVLPKELARDAARRDRFLAEAEAAAALNHPNVCVIHEIGETADARPFIAMEYLEGDTLQERLRSGSLSFSTQLDIALQVTAALEAAHRKGVVHRDIKPGNISVSCDGLVKVLDFGLAKRIGFADEALASESATQFRTQEGIVLGTPHYMSPEQALGRTVDARTDIFSLGVVLYELAAGQRPFEGDSAPETINNVINANPDSPSKLNSEVPAEFERIINRCLKKNPDARYESTTALLEDLRRVKRKTESMPATLVTDRDDTGIGRTSENRSRTTSGVVLFGVGAILLLLAWGAVTFFDVPPGEERGSHDADPPVDEVAESLDQIRSLAVLLPRTIGQRSDEGFDEVIHVLLTNELGGIGDLQVTSPYSASLYKDSDKPISAIGRELGVDGIVETHIFREADQINLSAHLVSVASETQIWNESFNGAVSELETLKRNFAVAIATEIDSALTGGSSRSRSIDVEAFEYYLRGSKARNLYTREGLETAVREYEAAVAIDDRYAAAWAGLAESYRLLSTVFWTPKEAMPRAIAAADKALELDSGSVEAQTTRALIRLTYEWQWQTARDEIDTALHLNANYADAYLADGWWLTAQGRYESSVETLKLAQKLDPFSLSLSMMLEIAYMMAPDQLDQAIQQCRRSLALDENQSVARADLAICLAAVGRTREARQAIQRWEQQQLEKPDDSLMPSALIANAYAVLGDRQRAGALLQRLQEQNAPRNYVCNYELGTAYLALGDRQKAIRWLEQSVEDRSDCVAWINVDARLLPLQEDARYGDRLRQLRALAGFD